jgi:soluble lytic murein transglycosylase-like protein
MRLKSTWLMLLLANVAACSTLIPVPALAYAHAYACVEDRQSCRLSDTSSHLNPLEPTPDTEPRMSVLPPPETYEAGVEYPEPVRDRAVKWAKVFEIPSPWLISLGYVESRNQPMAKNESGATGALQIKLARAKDLVTWLNRSKWKTHQRVQEILSAFWHGMRDDLLNLDLNVMLAAFELYRLGRRFGGNHRIVSAAYNQGEGHIARCLERGLPLPARAIEFIARMERAKRLGYA